jgi:hypothetical protein
LKVLLLQQNIFSKQKFATFSGVKNNLLNLTMYDEFGFPEEYIFQEEATEYATSDVEPKADTSEDVDFDDVSSSPIRYNFPDASSNYMGGTSDGWEYRTIFGGSKLENSYKMLQLFLEEEGYNNIPIPENVEELKLFKKPRLGQQTLFAERGYIHNPIKILFSNDPKQRNMLILCVYNEKSPKHLQRFHGIN